MRSLFRSLIPGGKGDSLDAVVEPAVERPARDLRPPDSDPASASEVEAEPAGLAIARWPDLADSASNHASPATADPVETLDSIGLRHKLDKASTFHDYLRHFEAALRHLQGRPITILEFCEASDASLLTWLEFFPLAKVVAVFSDEQYRRFASDRITVEIGFQNDPGLLGRLVATVAPEVVIDDGSHIWAQQITTLRHMFPALRPDGVYIIEDLQTSFGEEHKGFGQGAAVSGYAYLQSLLPGLMAGDGFVQDQADEFAHHFAASADSMTMIRKACLIRKRRDAGGAVLQTVGMKDMGDTVVPVSNGGDYARNILDKVVGAQPWITEALERQKRRPLVRTPPGFVGTFRDAIVHDPGVVRTASGSVIAESCRAPSPHRFFGFHRIEGLDRLVEDRVRDPGRRLDDRPYVLLRQVHDSNYGHWLVELLPRVAMVADTRSVAECGFIVPPFGGPMRQVYLDSLAILDVPVDRIFCMEEEAVQVSELVYASPITSTPWILAPRSITFLEQLGAKAMVRFGLKPGSQKIYASRNKFGSRRLLNEEDVIALLSGRGYEILFPERMSLLEQIASFSNARCVVGNLGAALTNLAFAPNRQVKFLALVTELMLDDFYWDLMAHKRGPYYALHGTATDPQRGMWSDFTIDLDAFTALLDEMEAA